MSDSRSIPDWALALARRAKDADGAPPFSDAAQIGYRQGSFELVAIDEAAAALVGDAEAEFVVDPIARGRGIGARMLERLISDGAARFWAHGDHPAARSLATRFGLRAARELLHLSLSLAGGSSTSSGTEERQAPDAAEGPSVSAFRVGLDEDEWVALNALTFRDHPEQGRVTKADVEALETESWFNADDFLLLVEGGRMIGYCWLKVEGDRGECYVVGVSPEHQGEHLGALLFDAGLARLRGLGLREAHLYVEADNEQALRLYRSRGFVRDAIDILYSV